MTFLVAAIEHHARVLATSLTRALTERCSGFSDYEAGDFLDDTCLLCGKLRSERYCRPGVMHGGKSPAWARDAEALAAYEAEQEVAEPKGCASRLKGCPCILADGEHIGGWHCCMHGAKFATPQTPAAGQRGENPAGVTPPTPAGSPDPSPTIVQSACQPTVGDEGSPEEIATFPDRPSGEHPTLRELVGEMHDSALVMRDQAKDAIPFNFHNGRRSALADVLAKLDGAQRPDWPTWAVPAICDVLAGHAPFAIADGGYFCEDYEGFTHGDFADWQEWREHVAPLIAERLDTAWRARQSHKPPQ